MRAFANSNANHRGVPLPRCRVRFYRRDQDGQVEFTGQNQIEHTPKDEIVRVYKGNAFDITGERRQTKFEVRMMMPNGYLKNQSRSTCAITRTRATRCASSSICTAVDELDD